MKLLEEKIHRIVKQVLLESYVSVDWLISRFEQQIPSWIGSEGSVESHLFTLSDYIPFPETNNYYYDDYDDEDYEEEEIDSTEIGRIWKQYAAAMSRRRPDSVLPYYSFKYYTMFHAKAFRYKDSYIFGQYSNGYFKISHFAPLNIRQGYEMLLDLCRYDNIIFTVTDDLSPMLEKIGLYGNDKAKIMMMFRDELVTKEIWTTDKQLLAYIVKKIAQEKMDEIYQIVNSDSNVDFRNIVREPMENDRRLLYRERMPMRNQTYKARWN